jgi:DNA-binding MarR family transcriptional regulator
MDNSERESALASPDAAFLLVQLGFYAARRFEERLAPLGIQPRQFGLLRLVADSEGQSQQALSEILHITKSRMVWLVDDLERHGLAERRRNPSDRRAYALYLTPKGRQILEEARKVVADHEADLFGSLEPAERRQLAGILHRVAADKGILGQVLPGQPPGEAARDDG